MVDGQRTDDGPWLYYKLTNEPKGSGELTIYFEGEISFIVKQSETSCSQQNIPGMGQIFSLNF